MSRTHSRKLVLTSAVAPLALLAALAAPASAQSSGAPASGTTLGPPAENTTSGIPAPGQAAAPATAEGEGTQGGGLQDIIVTARRTNEKLQTTPVAVTALPPTVLLQRQITEVTDLQRVTPSLSVGTGGTGPASIVYLAIRGQAQNSPNSFSDPAVGIYIDGVYVARAIVGNLGFLDPASAEVLRGPQGTLFGRNTTGGALNITTAQPTQKFEGYIKGGYGNYDAKVGEGVVNIPLTQDLAVRFAGRYDEHDGYYPNPFLGHRQGAIKGEYYGRGSIKWTPSSLPLTWVVSGDYTHYRDTGNATSVAAINPAGPLAAFYGISQGVRAGVIPGNAPIPLSATVSVPAALFTNFSTGPVGVPITAFLNSSFATPAQQAALISKNPFATYGAPTTGDREIDRLQNYNQAGSATSNLVVDLGDVTVKSITGYRKSRTYDSLSLTGTPTGGGAFVSEYKQHQFSEELQASGRIGKLQYIGGLYYFREAGSERSDSEIFYNTPIGAYNRNLGDFVSRSLGVFAQVNYNFTDRLRVTGGIRYTADRRFINRHALVDFRAADPVCNVGANIGKTISQAPCNDPNTAHFSYPAWLASIDYKITNDIFVYAKTSGADNSGGFNSRPVPAPYSSSFQPEKVRDAETGFKGEFLDRHLRTNLAAFYAWQSNVQRIINTTFVDPTTNQTELTQFVSNAGKAHVYGLEFEGDLIPWKGLDISGSAAYLHARYVRGSRFENQLVNGAIVSVDRSREPFTQAPKWTANIGGTQTFELDPGKLTLHADYAYISNRYFDYFTTGDPAQAAAVAVANRSSLIRSYAILSANVGFALKKPAIEIQVYGKNLTNKAYYTNVFNSYTGLGDTSQFIGTPRTYGVTVAYRF